MLGNKFLLLILMFFSVAANADIMSDLRDKARFLSKRQAILSQNIANADTPKYKAKELQRPNFIKNKNKLQLMTTSSGHINGKNGAKASYKVIKQKDSFDTTLDGNNVVLEEQMMKMSDNSLEYQETLRMMSKMSALMKTAIGDSQR